MNKKQHSNPWQLKHRLRSFGHSIAGWKSFIITEVHAAIHVVAALIVILLGIILKVDAIEWCILLLCIGIVLGMEMINTALERLCDAVHPETHKLIKQSKDIASGAVLLSVCISVIIAGIIFLPKILS